MQQLRHLMKDKRGSTLIEVIVSVLIVGIAFVPLMVGLNAALRINKNTEQELYAENVASNVIEVCKTYGTKGLAKLESFTDTNPSLGIQQVFPSAVLTKNTTDSSKFTITGIKSGTNERTYTATISFSTVSNNQNDFSGYPTVEGVKDAMVVSFADDNFKSVFNYFWEKAEPLNTNPVQSLTKDELKQNVSSWLTRELQITIEPVTVEDKEKIKISKKTIYTAENKQIDGKYTFGDSTKSAPAPFVLQEKEIGNYDELPSMIIVTYKAFKGADGKELKLGSGDDISITKTVDGNTNVYALCENASTLNGTKATIGYRANIQCHGKSESDISAYSNLTGSTVFAGVTLDTFGLSGSSKMSKMKNVEVSIVDNYGNVMVPSKTSTIIEFD